MLPGNRRIPRKILETVVRLGRREDSTHFFLKFLAHDEARFAVSVSKKISKSAVVRNRVRRRTYSAIRELISSAPKALFLVVAKPGAEKLKGEVLRMELAELLLKR